MSRPDLVIVGSGVAGLSAGRRAQQLGLRTVILEKFESGPGFGNGRLSGGWFHAAMMDPKLRHPDELYQTVIERCDGYARPNLVRVWADNVLRARQFLGDEGGTFGVLDPDDESKHNVLMPSRPAAIGRVWKDHGPDLLLTRMWRTYLDNGGDHRPGHRVTDLERSADGRIIGVWAETDTGRKLVEGEAVLLCDGGFQGNPELVARYITPFYKLRGSTFDTGDCLQMGLAAGAKTVNMDWFYGYALCKDAMTDDRLWPSPGPGMLIAFGMLVDGAGRRFVDENCGAERIANAIARSSTPGNCWAVFDEAIWQEKATLGDVPLNPILYEVDGTMKTADTLEGLAEIIGLPADGLARSRNELHAWADSGTACDPVRTAPFSPLAHPPFHAVPVVAGITFTMGGLLVNEHGQVLGDDEQAIPGLYAAGGTMGGLQGGPRIGVAGGWSEASTFGLLVAEHVHRCVSTPEAVA
jgi:fumarate reductase flavoprotein subunit